MTETEQIATAYWRYLEASRSPNRDARLAAEDPYSDLSEADSTVRKILAQAGPQAVEMIEALAATARTATQRSYLGAGPLENLWDDHTDTFLAELRAVPSGPPPAAEPDRCGPAATQPAV